MPVNKYGHVETYAYYIENCKVQINSEHQRHQIGFYGTSDKVNAKPLLCLQLTRNNGRKYFRIGVRELYAAKEIF